MGCVLEEGAKGQREKLLLVLVLGGGAAVSTTQVTAAVAPCAHLIRYGERHQSSLWLSLLREIPPSSAGPASSLPRMLKEFPVLALLLPALGDCTSKSGDE